MSQKNFSQLIPHPVTLLSVSDGNRENLATMSWICAVSRKPPLLMVSVSPRRFSHDMVIKAGEFAIIVLASSQKELSTLAGTMSGSEINKWELPQFKALKKSAIHISTSVLKNCLATFECKLVNQIIAGDHRIMVGEIIHMETESEDNPLILFNHQYHHLGNIVAAYP